MQRILCNFNYFLENLLVFCKSSSYFLQLKSYVTIYIFFIVLLDVASYFDIITLGIYQSPC